MNTIKVIRQKLIGQRDKSESIILNNGLKQGNRIEQIKNTMYIMKDTMGTIQYIDSAWFQVHANRERRRDKIIKGLVEIVNELISLEELNPFAVSYDPMQSSKNNTSLVELQNNDRIGNETISASIKE